MIIRPYWHMVAVGQRDGKEVKIIRYHPYVPGPVMDALSDREGAEVIRKMYREKGDIPEDFKILVQMVR